MGKPLYPQGIQENVLDHHNNGLSIRQISAQAWVSTEFIRNSTQTLWKKCCVTRQRKTEANLRQLWQLSTSVIFWFPAFIVYLKISYITGALENCSKGFFRRILKNTEMSEVKQWQAYVNWNTRNRKIGGWIWIPGFLTQKCIFKTAI